MKTIVKSFSNLQELDKIIKEDSIEDNSQLLIQLFVATPDIQTIKKYQVYLSTALPKSVLIGTTTDGTIMESNVYSETKNVISFTYFEKTEIKSKLIEHSNSDYDSCQTGKMMAHALIESDTKVLISFADGIYTNGEEYVNGLSTPNKHIVISGGLAGDNGNLLETYVFDNSTISKSGAVAAALNSTKLKLITDYSFDWMPLGRELTITKSIKNRVYEINGHSAVDMYRKYLGEELALQLPQIGIEFPLIMERHGVVVGRAVLSKHEDGSLTFAGNIEEGTVVRLGVGSMDMLLRNLDHNMHKLMDKSSKKIETIFIYSSMARRRFMGRYAEKELVLLSEQAPTAGFFTYGEFFYSQGKSQLLNETMTILALSESEEASVMYTDSSLAHADHMKINHFHAISHLANTVSIEFDDLQKTLENRIKKQVNNIYRQAYYDKLTTLPNRLKFLDDLEKAEGETLVLINIDEFSAINDFYGHAAGDTVLKQFAFLLGTEANKRNATLYRLPSDEFAAIVQGNVLEKIEDLMKNFLILLDKTDFYYNTHLIKITTTMSATLIKANNTDLGSVDMALKYAKHLNKSYMIYTEDMKLVKHYEENLHIANVLRKALSTDNILPYYQPIINLKTQKIDKYECLVRIIEEDDTVMSPFVFLAIAQKIKLYPEITKIMIEKCFKIFSETGENFSVNLDFDDIRNELTASYIYEKIEEYDIASQLTFEILETQELEHDPVIQKFVADMKMLGVKIAIDDFGSGYANFKHMTQIDTDLIKIDGSLIKNIVEDENSRLVVETIVLFAKKLGVKTVAEYIHNELVLDAVKEIGVDYGQGFFLGMPDSNLINRAEISL